MTIRVAAWLGSYTLLWAGFSAYVTVVMSR